ncbi:MAG: peptidylprolyl isomerase [Candidatus Woesearchaeota archaeon]
MSLLDNILSNLFRITLIGGISLARQVKKVPIGKQGTKGTHTKKESHPKKDDEEQKEQTDKADAHKSSPHTTHRKHTSKKRAPKPWFSRAVLLVLLLAAVGFFVYEEFDFNFGMEDRGPVAATVDGQEIYVSEVEEHFENIPEQMRAGMTEEVLLDQLISQEVLIQEAEKQDITVSEEDIDEELDYAMDQAGWSSEEFEEVLAAQGMTKDDLRDLYRVSIVIDELIQQKVLDGIDITRDDVAEFFEQNKEEFTPSDDEVRASHVLISTEQREEEEAREIAEEVVEKARDGEDFAQLVSEYSDDPSAEQNEGDLGFFTESEMVPEFSEAVFSLNETGEISEPIKTDFGFHVIKLTDMRKEGDEPELDDVYDQVEENLLNQRNSEAVEEYIMGLREESDIEKIDVEEIELPESGGQQQPGQGQEIEISEEDLEEMQEDGGMDVETQ